MRRSFITLAGALLLGACGAAKPAQDTPRASGSVTVLRTDLQSADGFEVIVQDVRFSANAELPRHYHPGEEYIYVIEGEVTYIEEGAEDRHYRAGDALRIGIAKAHAARTGDKPARAIIFRVHRKGEPERTLVE